MTKKTKKTKETKETKTSKINVAMPPSLREACEKSASLDNRELSDWVRIVLEQAVSTSRRK